MTKEYKSVEQKRSGKDSGATPMGSYSFARFCSAGFTLHVCRFGRRISCCVSILTRDKPITSTKATGFKYFIFANVSVVSVLALMSITLW